MVERKPTRAEIEAAVGNIVPDVIGPNLDVLFCGINPGLYSGAVGHHFAFPGNRFWPALHAAGFTGRVLEPHEERLLLKYGCGITNFVERATRSATDLTPEELEAGGRALREKVQSFKPQILAVLGIGAYRRAFHQPNAQVGLQDLVIGSTQVWALPNPSGLNAHYNLDNLADLYHQVRLAVETRPGNGGS